MTLSDLERLAREAIASKGKWRMDILLTEEERALWEAANPDTVLALLRVVRAAVAANESRCAPPCPAYLGDPHDGACPERADLVELTDALAVLNLKDET